MNQNRAFLLFAWFALAILLAFEWTRFTATPPAASPAPAPAAAVESSDAGLPTAAELPQAAAAPAAEAMVASDGLPTLADAPAPDPAPASLPSAGGRELEVLTDVLRLRIDSRGGALVFAELLAYPMDQEDRSKGNVILLDREATRFEVAQSGWLAASPAPGGDASWAFEQEAERLVLAEGQDRLEVPLVWRDEASGLVARKIYTLERGSYAISVRHELENAGTAAFSGSLFHQILKRPPPPPAKRSMFTNPESFSFVGAAWYTAADHFEKRKFEDFAGKGSLDKATTGGWLAMLRHHFLSAWVPPKDKAHTLSLHTVEGNRFAIRSVGQPLAVAPGERVAIDSTLWVGPKLQAPMKAIDPTLPLSLDYGIFSFLAQPLFWVLDWLHALFGNWGWAIIGIVVLLKLLLYPVSAKQYQSMARMRAIAPRIEQLKERYGEDRMKFNQAMMELYQKEKINPLGGCLPMLVPIPIFLALYWVLLESVELRQAPWILWIDNLTAPDPYFILPALNLAVMWLTQKLTPSPGMDPMQKKMLQWMPVVFGVLFAFFPSGLVLYWFTNGLLGLAQQWWMTKRYGETPALPAKAK
ncbi:MAG: membrane protein insertase YidC [Silanimonas sp.]|nr:MAG: membrane protein insertase YidC [Silanimonas sp.]